MYHCRAGIETASGNVIENNEIERLYTWYGNQSWPGRSCDYIHLFGDNIILRDNYFHGTLESEVGNSHVDAFQSFDNRQQSTKNILIENNIITDFYHQGLMLENDQYPGKNTISDWIVRNNVFADCNNSFIVAGKNANDGIPNMTIVNNVFANGKGFGIRFQGPYGTGSVFKNNILYNIKGGGRGGYYADFGAQVDAGYNLIYKTAASDIGTPVITDLVGDDPLFVNEAGKDFHVKSNSPAIDAGTDVGLTFDLEGITRPQHKGFDIGAYEYAGALSSKPITIEAEAMTLSGFVVDNGSKLQGTGIKIDPNSTTGTATSTFNGASGTYEVKLSVIPENDGQPIVKLYVGSNKILEKTYPVDATYFDYSFRQEYVVANVVVNNGDVIKIEGTKDQNAWARVDKVVFTPLFITDIAFVPETPVTVSINSNPVVDNIQFTFGTNVNPSAVYIYDSAGKMVKNISLETIGSAVSPGAYSGAGRNHELSLQLIRWNGTDLSGAVTEPGVYVYAIKANGRLLTGKFVKVK